MNYSEKRRRFFEAGEPWLYLMPFLVFAAVVIVYPIINVFILSFLKNYNALRVTFDSVSFDNYAKVLADEKFRSALKNTLLYVIESILEPITCRDLST